LLFYSPSTSKVLVNELSFPIPLYGHSVQQIDNSFMQTRYFQNGTCGKAEKKKRTKYLEPLDWCGFSLLPQQLSPWPGLHGFAYGSGAEVVTNQSPFYLFYIWRSAKVTANRLDFPRLPASGRTGKWPLSTKTITFSSAKDQQPPCYVPPAAVSSNIYIEVSSIFIHRPDESPLPHTDAVAAFGVVNSWTF
jgi:hypothetical protein